MGVVAPVCAIHRCCACGWGVMGGALGIADMSCIWVGSAWHIQSIVHEHG
jgi:hypothetical protein